MKTIAIIAVIAMAGCLLFLLARKKPVGDPMRRLATAAVARGDFQFMALLHEDGTKTLPEVPDIPAWYFETTGVNFLTVRPETQAPELALRMKSYNDALYQELKAQGKLHMIEENITRVKADHDKNEQTQKGN
jgi:flagellar basal body-associated protein FliL